MRPEYVFAAERSFQPLTKTAWRYKASHPTNGGLSEGAYINACTTIRRATEKSCRKLSNPGNSKINTVIGHLDFAPCTHRQLVVFNRPTAHGLNLIAPTTIRLTKNVATGSRLETSRKRLCSHVSAACIDGDEGDTLGSSTPR